MKLHVYELPIAYSQIRNTFEIDMLKLIQIW